MSRSKYYLSKSLMVNADDGSETKTEVDILNRKRRSTMKKQRKRRWTMKRQRRYLPPEIVFEILSRLPAPVIHDVMTHVCNEWNLMISTKSFIHYHLQNSTPGILIIEQRRPANGVYVEIRGGFVEIWKYECRDFRFHGSSVNGLVLATPDMIQGNVLYIINPVTNQHESIPYDGALVRKITLAFAEVSMKYKAVRSLCSDSPSPSCISMLTIGVDNAWRYLDVQHLSMPAQEALWYYPYVTRGYVHWIGTYSVVTLNVETEIIYEFARSVFGSTILPTELGNNLSSCHLSQLPESREYLMEVMEMNPQTGVWTKVLSSDLKPLSDKFKNLNSVTPFGVLAGGEVFLFGISYSQKHLFAAYNVRTREIQSLELEIDAQECSSGAHLNTMIWYR